MRSFNFFQNYKKLLAPDVVLLLTHIHESRGEQALFIESRADTLSRLVEIARIQSTEASNAIEGIHTSNERLKRLVLDKTTPHTRNEQEIAGYRDVLTTIHESFDYIQPNPSVILQLHRDLYKFSGSSCGGHYKNCDNVIAETDEAGNKIVRLQPVQAWETPEYVEQLCSSFAEALASNDMDPLLLIPMFILDFLCIHPFNDGNGRMSRLLTLLLLYRAGYIVGKYISIEKLIEESKVTYYETLRLSSCGWHEETNDYSPFVRYMLGIVSAAYREFSSRVQILATEILRKPERISELIKRTPGKITKKEILERCPDIRLVTVQRTLLELQKSGIILKLGGGRYTSYVWNSKEK